MYTRDEKFALKKSSLHELCKKGVFNRKEVEELVKTLYKEHLSEVTNIPPVKIDEETVKAQRVESGVYSTDKLMSEIKQQIA